MLDTSKIPTKRVDGYYTHITNCITKIPQDIKLSYENGMVKVGVGKVYDGAGNVININSEISRTLTPDVQLMLFVDLAGENIAYCAATFQAFSGDTPPTTTQTTYCWYDTTEKKVKAFVNSVYNADFSLPIGLLDVDGTITAFNGFGFIGSTIFVLPGVEGIIPNGFNEDGSIKNIHCQIEEVQTKQTLNGWNNHWYVHLMGEDLIEYHPWELYYNQVDKPMSVGQTAYWYNPNEKIVKSTDDFGTTWNTTRQVTPFLEVFQNGETITSIKPINVYENITSKTVENKFKVVSELPSFPEVGVFYFVKE